MTQNTYDKKKLVRKYNDNLIVHIFLLDTNTLVFVMYSDFTCTITAFNSGTQLCFVIDTVLAHVEFPNHTNVHFAVHQYILFNKHKCTGKLKGCLHMKSFDNI